MVHMREREKVAARQALYRLLAERPRTLLELARTVETIGYRNTRLLVSGMAKRGHVAYDPVREVWRTNVRETPPFDYAEIAEARRGARRRANA